MSEIRSLVISIVLVSTIMLAAMVMNTTINSVVVDEPTVFTH